MGITSALSGVRVLELANYIPGPVCTQVLANMGAAIVKVEPPGGDPMRRLAPAGPDGINPLFRAMNTGKTCVTLDLKREADVAELRSQARLADVLVDGFRPGVLARLGLDAVELGAENPRLITCAISGFGLEGAQHTRAGHDLNFLAQAGFLAMNVANDVPAMPGSQVADMLSGLAAATAIVAALHQRERSGLGQILDAPMQAAAHWLMAPWQAATQVGVPVAPDARVGLSGDLACYRMYRTADGRYLAVAALEAHFWAGFCREVQRPEWMALQYDWPAQPTLIADVAALIGTRVLADWAERFAELDVCVTPVLHVEEAAAASAVSLALPVRTVERSL
jgi:alpha-methylacyl-CoA racemase